LKHGEYKVSKNTTKKLHKIDSRRYGQLPSTLIISATHDGRVPPVHSLKYIAEIYRQIYQHANKITLWQKNNNWAYTRQHWTWRMETFIK